MKPVPSPPFPEQKKKTTPHNLPSRDPPLRPRDWSKDLAKHEEP